jgi:hypothetical protein
VQAAVEGVEIAADRKVPFMGAEFKMASKIGLAPLMLLAVAARKGVDAADEAGLAALHDVIQDCIDESEHPRFWRHAVDTKADADDFMKAVQHVIQDLAARPTSPPGGSSTGRRATSASSKASSSKTAMGEPDDGMTSVDSLLGR